MSADGCESYGIENYICCNNQCHLDGADPETDCGCNAGDILDCSGNCYNESLGMHLDNRCDDGTGLEGINLMCSTFNYDSCACYQKYCAGCGTSAPNDQNIINMCDACAIQDCETLYNSCDNCDEGFDVRSSI